MSEPSSRKVPTPEKRAEWRPFEPTARSKEEAQRLLRTKDDFGWTISPEERERRVALALYRERGEDDMPVMTPAVRVWAEEGGIELRAVPGPGTVEISILKDGKVAATATVARYRWDRVWQSVLPASE